MKSLFIYIIGIIIAIVIAIGFWQIGRKINYNLSYEDMVKQTVREMVKEDNLK